MRVSSLEKDPAQKPADGRQKFGEIAVREGMLQDEQLEEGLSIQARQRKIAQLGGNPNPGDRLGEILERRGYMSKEDVRHVLDVQSRSAFSERGERRERAPRAPVGSESAASPDSPASSEEPLESVARLNRQRLGDYVLLKKLGKGAMGSVYLAKQVSQNRKVALKILSPDMAQDKEYVERFRREARAATKLDHPNLVKAYEVGVVNDLHYIAMEYVDGGDLDSILEKRSCLAEKGRFRSKEVVQIAKDMGRALLEAGRHGIVHRDIKPANILASSEGSYKLTDLGLAARTKDDIRVTQTGHAVGTPYYISPELAQGKQIVDERSDIYSLGATLYHLATGQVPFPGENGVVVMTRHITEPLRPPREVQPRIPKSLSRLIEKMMAKRPMDRQQSAEELLEDIELIEHGGVPLLRRALARPKSSSSDSGWETLAEEDRESKAVVPQASKHSRHPRGTLHPRASRYPLGRKGRWQGGPRSMVANMVFFLVILMAGVVAGMYFMNIINRKDGAPLQNTVKPVRE